MQSKLCNEEIVDDVVDRIIIYWIEFNMNKKVAAKNETEQIELIFGRAKRRNNDEIVKNINEIRVKIIGEGVDYGKNGRRLLGKD